MSKKTSNTEIIRHNKFTITQSLMKTLRDYHDGKGECGLQIESRYIRKEWDLYKPSDVMLLGTWFEYKITGALPKNNIIPEPLKTLTGKLTVPYERMEKHVNNFKKLQKFLKFEIISIGTTWVWEDLAGTLDLLCLATVDIIQEKLVVVKKGKKFIVDIKSTGLLDDKWNPYGWDLANLGNKFKIITQPIHYKYIGMKLFGEDIPFLFFLFHSNKENDFRIINFEVDKDVYSSDDESRTDTHEFSIKYTRDWMNYYVKNGFTSYLKDKEGIIYPSVEKCAECPLKVGCKDFRIIPAIQTFYHSLDNIDQKYNH